MRAPVVLLFACAGLLSSCGGDPSDAGAATEPLTLDWLDEAPPARRRLASVPLPEDERAWGAEADVVELAGPVDARHLELRGDRDVRTWFPAGDALSETDVVVVEAASSRPTRLRVGWGALDERGQPTASWAQEVVVLDGGTRTRAEFPVEPGTGDTHLVLRAHARRAVGVQVLGVELQQAPIERRVAAIDEEPRWTTLGGEARPAFAVAQGRDVGCTLTLPPGGRVAFGWAPAGDEAGHGALRATLEPADGAARTDAVELDLDLDGEPRAWRDTTLRSPWSTARRVRLRFAVRGARFALVTPPRLERPRVDPPTVLLVSSDTHRADHVAGVPQAARVVTPTLERLAAEGVLFERAFSSSNFTLPSHATLMTGIGPRDTGILDNSTRLGEAARTLAETFHANGWATLAVVSARHLRPDWSGLGQGFERVSVPEGIERPAGESVAVALEWLAAVQDRPLFLWLHVFDAHRPYEAPEEAVRASYGKPDDPRDPALPEPTLPVPEEVRGVRDLEWVRALYRAQIDGLDRALGELLEHPRMDLAVVAFTADHGESHGEAGLWWDHIGVFPAVLRVPLILRWPGGPRGVRVARTVAQADVGHTLLGLAGIPADFPGDDLRAWTGESAPERIRFAVAAGERGYAVTREGWHLTVTLHDGSKPEQRTQDNARDHPVQLFDLDRDPRCERNVAEEQRARVAELGGALLGWLGEDRPSLAASGPSSADARATVAELGYASGGDSGDDSRPPGEAAGARGNLERVRALLQPFLPDGSGPAPIIDGVAAPATSR